MSVQAETKIVPWGSVRERYDTNVFFRPASLLRDAQGNIPRADDIVSNVSGGIEVQHDGRDVEANVRVGGTYGAYVYNPQLNFYGSTLTGRVGLDRWVDQYVRGAKLQISQNLRYSPEPPSFLTGISDGNTTFLGGLQPFRRSTLINTTSFKGVYPVSRDLFLEGGYTFGLRRVGKTILGDVAGATFFNTMVHTLSAGPRYHLTRNDSIGISYEYSFITQSRSEGGRTFNTNLVTLQSDYTKNFQEWSIVLKGGVTFIEPANRTLPVGSIQVSTQADRDTVLTLTLSRSARPSYYLQGGANISNLARAGFKHTIYERLIVDGYAGYAVNELFPNTNSQFQNFTGASRLTYKLTRNITGELFYQFSNIKSEQTQLEYQFSRHQVGFMLTVLWDLAGLGAELE